MSEPFGLETRRKIIGRFLTRLPLVYWTPVYIGILAREAQPLTASGTATLLQIGNRKLIVTDDHVLAGFEKEAALDSRCEFQIGVSPFSPMERLIDRNGRKDLCVLDVSGLDFRRSLRNSRHAP